MVGDAFNAVVFYTVLTLSFGFKTLLESGVWTVVMVVRRLNWRLMRLRYGVIMGA